MKTQQLIDQLSDEGLSQKQQPHLTSRACLCITLVFLYFLLVIVLQELRIDIQDKLQQNLFVIEILISLAMGISGAFAATWLSLPDVNQQPTMRAIPFIFLLALSIMIISQYFIYPVDGIDNGLQCFINLSLTIIIPTCFVFYLITKAASVYGGLTGVAVGLFVNGFGYATSRITEINDNIGHVLLWHFLPMIAIIVFLLLLGHIIFKKGIWKKTLMTQ